MTRRLALCERIDGPTDKAVIETVAAAIEGAIARGVTEKDVAENT